jgi:hypothetical protein
MATEAIAGAEALVTRSTEMNCIAKKVQYKLWKELKTTTTTSCKKNLSLFWIDHLLRTDA